MKSYMLDLNSIERVKGFVNAIESFEGNFDLEFVHGFAEAC